jgi:hypothetical protein
LPTYDSADLALFRSPSSPGIAQRLPLPDFFIVAEAGRLLFGVSLSQNGLDCRRKEMEEDEKPEVKRPKFSLHLATLESEYSRWIIDDLFTLRQSELHHCDESHFESCCRKTGMDWQTRSCFSDFL